MNARLSLFLAVALALPLACTATTAGAAPAIQGRQVSVDAGDVQQYLGGTFPQTHDALGGLLELTVSHPQLTLPPGNRLNLGFDLAMATAGVEPSVRTLPWMTRLLAPTVKFKTNAASVPSVYRL